MKTTGEQHGDKKRHPVLPGCQFEIKGSVWHGGPEGLYPVTLYSRNMKLISADFGLGASVK